MEFFKTGDSIKRFLEGKGTIIARCGAGYVIQFDNGITNKK